MSFPMRSIFAGLLLCVTCLGPPAWAGNEGQEDLDRASEAKLTARTMNDLDQVIRLCRSAMDKGLEPTDVPFATNLLAATLIQRGSARMEVLARISPTDLKWNDIRKAALDDLQQGVKLTPEQPEALLSIAQLQLLPGGDAKEAAEALGKAIEFAAENPQLKAKALTMRASIEKDPEKKLADLDAAVLAVPDDPAALRARGLLRADAGKLDDALKDLDKAIELDPTHAPTYELKALVLAQMKKYDEALVSLDRVSELLPKSAGPLMQKARVHVAAGNLAAALHELDQAQSMEPDNVSVLLLRAAVYQESGETEKALADVEQTLKLKPDLTSAVRIRATLLAGAGRLDEAIAQMEDLRRKEPADEMVLLQLGTLYNAAKKPDKAMECFSTLLAQEPDNWLALRSRADTLLNVGKQEEAVADYEKAVKIEPKDSGILNNYAWVLATSTTDKVRNGRRALELATEACRLTDYKQAHILSTLAAAYAETGDFESAKKWSEKAVEQSDGEHREALRKELESYRAGKPWRERIEGP